MAEGSPKVSIVLPTYNGAKYIRQSIESCLDQTYKNIELIIVDDASTDETPKIVKSYADPRLVYIRHEKNMKLPAAFNTGFSRASGDYLTWTSDDNFYDVSAIDKMLGFMRDNACDFVYCDFYEVKMVDILVRFKHGLLTAGSACEKLISLAANDQIRLYKVRKAIKRTLMSGKIDGNLAAYRNGKITFTQLRTAILKMLYRTNDVS